MAITHTELAMVIHMMELTNLSIRRMNVPPKTSYLHQPFPPAIFPLGQRLVRLSVQQPPSPPPLLLMK